MPSLGVSRSCRSAALVVGCRGGGARQSRGADRSSSSRRCPDGARIARAGASDAGGGAAVASRFFHPARRSSLFCAAPAPLPRLPRRDAARPGLTANARMLHRSNPAFAEDTMADLHRTIDRSIRISRTVGDLLQRRVRKAGDALRRAPRGRHEAALRPARRPRRRSSSGASGRSTRSMRRSARCCSGTRCAAAATSGSSTRRAGKPPLLHYEYEMIADARAFERPVQLRAGAHRAAAAASTVDDACARSSIIDPRAGHGPGIGGFKEDSEVGVALSAGHPVYFVDLLSRPEPGQTLADVIDAEAEFVRIVARAPSATARSRCWSATARAAGR